MKKIIHSFIVVLIFTSALSAQGYITNLAYSIGIPEGNTSKFIDNTSYIGFILDGRRFVAKNVTAGISVGWNVFHYETHETIEFDNGAVTGRQFRYINAIPIMLNTHYYLGHRRGVRPFIGVAAGVYYVHQRLELGVFARDNDTWHFAVAPEAGALIPLSRDVSFFASAKYNYLFDSGTTVYDSNDNSQSFIAINLGFSFVGF